MQHRSFATSGPVAPRLIRAACCALRVRGLLGRQPAAADFRLCNNTGSRVGIALGYKDGDGWITEGWWNLAPRTCETLLRGTLVARFYYIYAIDYDRGGEWSGQGLHVHARQGIHHPRHRGLPGARL